MADPVVRLSCGDEHFDLADLMSDEMAQIKSWAGCKNRGAFYAALREEDPDAIVAAFAVARWRATGEKPRISDVKINLDKLEWSRHIDERTVKLITEEKDGKPLLVQVDAAGNPLKDDAGNYLEPQGVEGERVGLVPLTDDAGNLRWRYVDTGEEAVPTQEPATSGSTGSPTTAKKQRGSDSTSGTEDTNAA